jgi:hypothetical protein
MKYKLISYVDLGSFPKIFHYVYANILKSEKIQNLKYFWSQEFWIRDTQLILFPVVEEVGGPYRKKYYHPTFSHHEECDDKFPKSMSYFLYAFLYHQRGS